VAVAETAARSGDIVGNVATGVALTERASALGARVVVFPELALTGYDPAVWDDEHALTEDDARLLPLSEAARSGAITIVTSGAVLRDGHRTLSALVVGVNGRVRAPYDKQYLSGPDEQGAFVAGDHGSSIVVDGWDLGLSVCYDGSFPEHAQAAAADGALGYLACSAFFTGGEHRRDLYYAARALDNGMYVVFSGLVGEGFCGGSAIYDPEGRALVRAQGVNDVVVADFERAEVDRVRGMNPMASDRRESLGKRQRWVVS
jgi:predicted amidohydrolase